MDYEHKKRGLSLGNMRKSSCVLGAGVLICNLMKTTAIDLRS
jgi:hypothetical protein